MPNPDKQLLLAKQIQDEVQDYISKDVDLGDKIKYSQHKLTRRIALFESKTYPTGKFDKQGNYKYWFDIINPRVDAEVKNIDFDTKDVEAYSPHKVHEVPDLIVNMKLTEWLRDNGQSEELNSAIEEGAGWGNIVWKKVGKGYERVDLRNFYVINQTARSLNDSPAIERHQVSQTKLNKMKAAGKYTDIEKIIANCGENSYKANEGVVDDSETTTPYYLLFERNGEVSVAALKQFRKEKIEKGDEETYVYAKVIGAGVETKGGAIKIKYVAFAEESTNPYKEYHRSRYKGRWFREGLYELLFDYQVRANEVGNQLARGLEWASKTVFASDDKLFIQNILSDLKNGDIIKSANLRQVEVRMQGADQLLAEWNRIIGAANEIANSREIVQGEGLSGQPFRLGALLNTNANKLFDFIREKLSIPLREIFEEWIVPDLIAELKMEEVLRLTGDSNMMNRMYALIVEDWYARNLVNLPPHGEEVAKILKGEKIEELKRDKAIFMREFQEVFEGYKARVAVVITGENVDLPEQLQTLGTFIQLEADPVRRTYLIERAMRLKGIDVGDLPRSTPDQLSGVTPDTRVEAPPVGAAAAEAAA